ncbi:MAG: methyltransferase domain-containing protein [Tildeniella torsiva UHER 1998/13D]|jgi:SAM-dependent methyltransferase|nr:methyltransferase domain-containing protein [Tildeniella torsiva UHER 1998/13D]
MKALNLGCGQRYHPNWVNIDFASHSKEVIAYDLSTGIPAADNAFDLVYHSHLLEHFPKDQAPAFIQECFRVLRPKGVLRVVVPDLETIARHYLHVLENSSTKDSDLADNYDWILLELLDQMVRNKSGGGMTEYLSRKDLSNLDFVIKRLGAEAKNLVPVVDQIPNHTNELEIGFSFLSEIVETAVKPIYRFLRYSSHRHNAFLQLVLGSKDYQALQIGRFRQGGEIHQWMYDCYSVSRLLRKCGFTDIVQRTALTSYIPYWPSYNLDTELDGSTYKPDSLFIEAIKPAQ